MNKALFWWGFGVIIILLLVAWGFSRSEKQDPDGFGALPWIEVIADDVVVTMSENDEAFVAQTGDELPDGALIVTSATGAARIHFPDGSFARLDPSSELTITSVSFDPKNDELLVRMMLASGTVWSKVVSLATEDSLWEVRTSQAVAAVRGTAFGVDVENENTMRVIGIEDKVVVTHTDDTNEDEVVVTPDTEVSMRDKVMSDLLALRDDMKNDEDYQRFVDEKEAFDTMLEELRGAYKSEREWRKALREQKVEAFRDAMREARGNRRRTTDNSQQTTNNPQPTTEEMESDELEVREVPVVPGREFIRLDVVPGRALDRVIEGDNIGFKAFLVSSTGEQEDITTKAQWNVVGDIGAFEKPGSFKASLKPEHREYGSWPGGVSVKFKDIQTQKEFEGATAPFKVHTKLQVNPITEG